LEKSEIIALLFLSKQDLSHLKTYGDYIDQFNETEKQVKAVLENRKSKSSPD